jgi:hypothetical protein
LVTKVTKGEIMFENKCTGEINFRVVLYGPAYVGRTATLKSIYDRLPADQKGRLVILESKAEKTVFFDVAQPEFGECDGKRVRLQLCALHGDVNYVASSQLLLKNVDAIVFLADAQRERRETNRYWADLLGKHLAELGRGLDRIPLCVAVTKSTFENADEEDQIVGSLDLPPAPTFRIDPTTGSNTAAMLMALVKALKEGVAVGTVTGTMIEGKSLADGLGRGLEYLAREGLVSHYRARLGGDSRIYKPNAIPENRPEFVVVGLRPTPSRPYYTYATAGLSLWTPTPSGSQPRLELLAYSPTEEERVAEVLVVLGKEILGLAKDDAPFNALDTIDLTGVGLVHDKYVLAPPLESEELLRFPDPAQRMLDVWFTESLAGHQDDATPDPAFVHLVPVTDDEVDFAREKGTPALLKKMNLAKRGKAFGWSRGPAESTLKSKFFGLLH